MTVDRDTRERWAAEDAMAAGAENKASVIRRQDQHERLRCVFDSIPHGPAAVPGTEYAYTDIFPVRHDLIRDLDPAPASVFEFGSLVGYFLLTAVDAAPTIDRIAWIDDERVHPGSNEKCLENLREYAAAHDRDFRISYGTTAREAISAGQFDLVQVDGSHSYPDCLTDLIWALHLGPRWIFVDDYVAFPEVAQAVAVFSHLHGLTFTEHRTVNGLAVIEVPEQQAAEALARRGGMVNEPPMEAAA